MFREKSQRISFPYYRFPGETYYLTLLRRTDVPYVVTNSLSSAESTYRTSIRKSIFKYSRKNIFRPCASKTLKSPALRDAGTLRDWPPFCILLPLSCACAVRSRSISVEIFMCQFVVIFSLVCCNRFIKSFVPKCSQFSVE